MHADGTHPLALPPPPLSSPPPRAGANLEELLALLPPPPAPPFPIAGARRVVIVNELNSVVSSWPGELSGSDTEASGTEEPAAGAVKHWDSW